MRNCISLSLFTMNQKLFSRLVENVCTNKIQGCLELLAIKKIIFCSNLNQKHRLILKNCHNRFYESYSEAVFQAFERIFFSYFGQGQKSLFQRTVKDQWLERQPRTFRGYIDKLLSRSHNLSSFKEFARSKVPLRVLTQGDFNSQYFRNIKETPILIFQYPTTTPSRFLSKTGAFSEL